MKRACPICLSSGPRRVLHRLRFVGGPLGRGYEVAVCGHCGAGFADGIPSQRAMDRYYARQSKYEYQQSGGAESPYDLRRFERIVRHLGPLIPSRRAAILDVGCSTGGLLHRLQAHGYTRLVGADPSRACARAARLVYGLEVKPATIAQLSSWRGRFDLILLVGVLEHLREAREAVAAVARLLAPGGALYCAQPDVQAFAECLTPPYQQFSMEHVNFFSRSSLNALMGACGLVPRKTWRWMVEWRQGVTDSVVAGLYVRGPRLAQVKPDRITELALGRYLRASASRDRKFHARISNLVRAREPLLVWGAGTLARRLLADTGLDRAKIVAFVDSNPHLQGRRLAGRPIWSPSRLTGRCEAILICSTVFAAEIKQNIRRTLGLPNKIHVLA